MTKEKLHEAGQLSYKIRQLELHLGAVDGDLGKEEVNETVLLLKEFIDLDSYKQKLSDRIDELNNRFAEL